MKKITDKEAFLYALRRVFNPSSPLWGELCCVSWIRNGQEACEYFRRFVAPYILSQQNIEKAIEDFNEENSFIFFCIKQYIRELEHKQNLKRSTDNAFRY